MTKAITTLSLLFGVLVFLLSPTVTQAQTTTAIASDAITVVIQIVPIAGANQSATNTALKDMVAMIKRQPGFLSDEFLLNLNPANTPSHVHVIRWASLKYWENVFIAPEFAKLNAANSKLFSVSASAFKPAK